MSGYLEYMEMSRICNQAARDLMAANAGDMAANWYALGKIYAERANNIKLEEVNVKRTGSPVRA